MSEYLQIKRQTVCDIADAIRELSGSTAKIKGCDFDDKIRGCITSNPLDALIDKSITEVTSNVETIGDYAFYKCRNLTSANFPLATSVGASAFQLCTALENVNFPEATSIGSGAFRGTSKVKRVKLPAATTLASEAFAVSGLEFADFTALTSIASKAFTLATALKALILRGNTVVELANRDAFDQPPGGIYVPAALVDTYKAATNWSTYNTWIRALEDYTVDGTITGEFDETKI